MPKFELNDPLAFIVNKKVVSGIAFCWPMNVFDCMLLSCNEQVSE